MTTDYAYHYATEPMFFIMVKVCKFKPITFFKVLIKENEIYNIKTRLHLGLFSVKTLLQPSFALADMIFTNISPRGF